MSSIDEFKDILLDILREQKCTFVKSSWKELKETSAEFSCLSSGRGNVRRNDSDKIRQKILNVSYTEWQKMGFSKGTLYYIKKNAKAEKPFSLNKHVRERLDQWNLKDGATNRNSEGLIFGGLGN